MDILTSVLGLTALQVVLGIDNVIFLSIVTSKLNPEVRAKARKIGVLISMCMNAVLISFAGLLTNMHEELFSILGQNFDGHDLVMIVGGFFLVFKAVKELYQKIEMKDEERPIVNSSLFKIIMTMTMIDLVFSIDSTVTAVGMSDVRWIQIVSTLTAVAIMFFFFVPLNRFVEKHPSFKILALTFLVMIGFALFVDGMGVHLPKSYVYSIMVFAILMETLNIRFDKNSKQLKTTLLFSVNDHVRVKLTNDGLERLKEYYKPFGHKVEYMIGSKADEEGYHTFQMHEFMEIFGPECSLNHHFDTNILLNEKELKRV